MLWLKIGNVYLISIFDYVEDIAQYLAFIAL
jgi:hypothetical protein